MADNKKWLFVGLGNPGKEYETTRHNAGFILLDEIAEKIGCEFTKKAHSGLLAEGTFNGQKVILLKPQTYMNASGESVFAVAKYYKIPLERIIVIYDDVNFKVGSLKVKENGSAGGHKGLGDIIAHFGENVVRIKLGVDKPQEKFEMKDWVLSKFTGEEVEKLKTLKESVCEILQCFTSGDIAKAMNKFNRV